MAHELGNHKKLTETNSSSKNYQEITNNIVEFYIAINTIYHSNHSVNKKKIIWSDCYNIAEIYFIIIKLMLEMSVPVYSQATTSVVNVSINKKNNTDSKRDVEIIKSSHVNSSELIDDSGLVSKADATQNNVSEVQRPPQPIANPNDVLYSHIKNYQEKVQSKFIELNSNINSLYDRVRKLQMRNISSHVACEIKNTKVQCSDSEKSILKFNNFENIKTEKLERLFDLAAYLDDEATDEEFILESNACSSEKKGKRKLVSVPPSPEELYKWRCKQVKLGSQCSWLNLKIPLLDEKIDILNKNHIKLKQKRLSLNQNTGKNVSNDLFNYEGSRRTLPVSSHYKHSYVKKDTGSYSDTAVQCHNSENLVPCHLCESFLVQSQNKVNLNAVQLDHSYHSILSLPADICLSYKLEETMRMQKLNTKVKISKAIKKKKKFKLKNIPKLNVEVPVEKAKIQRRPALKLKNEPKIDSLVSDDSRKLTTTHELSRPNRIRQVRKISDCLNYDSSKPSTPTSECSPLSQSSMIIKQKKKPSLSVDYDINNIIIPYSIAASTRLERIQYKEIPTPGWRNINEFQEDDENNEDVELTDDELYEERHDRCEALEQKRYTNFVQVGRRNRSNRISEGFSEPPSPLHTVEDYFKSNLNTPVDSPCSGSTSLTRISQISNLTPVPESERDDSWKIRQFPLSDLECMQLDTSDCGKSWFRYPSLSDSFRFSPRCSPLSSRHTASPLNSPVNQNPDKNWTVKLISDAQKAVEYEEKVHKGIVLKLAKK
ncbi:KAT8 regulatory NSL complex subunit 1-like protein isoform X1 [Hydra vulgaris]|uniref:KAT8 regulatory NSL complex subunit 1-like protein isoform X1 n=1 Tax=Hydra vulgaris TaxID=6087 RepID=UPI001F5FE780|nr:KAT8 regulatory NSL complex subunit 1-like protein [Hydra vulgaris]